jgi:y4mF family transcriptional regulator
MTIGEQLKSIRKNYALTQEQLAFQSGVSFTFINRVENGNNSIRLEILNKVLDLLGCELAIVDKKTKKIIEITK